MPSDDNGTSERDGSVDLLRDLRPIEGFAKWFYAALCMIVVLVGGAIGIQNCSDDAGCGAFGKILLTWGVSFSVAAASSMVGCLLGFLFGIPRSLQQRGAADAEAPKPGEQGAAAGDKPGAGTKRAFRSNTSLEEISDWLTKIIIGVGLVQFQTFVSYLYKASVLAAAFVGGKPITIKPDADPFTYDVVLASPFFFALIVATLVAGCLFAYLETRTRLTLLLDGAERAADQANIAKFERAGVDKVATVGPFAGLPVTKAEPTKNDDEIAQVPRGELVGTKQIVGWASAQARRGYYQIAEDALRDALQKDPENDDIRLRIAEVRQLRKNYSGASEMMNELIGRAKDPEKKIALLRRALLSALYMPPPAGFEEAIRLSDQLLAIQGGANAQVYLWRASAFGQKYDWLSKNSGSDKDKSEVADKALACIKKVVELAPNPQSAERNLLRQLYDPARERSSLTENDLEVFRQDTKTEPAFTPVIYPVTPPAATASDKPNADAPKSDVPPPVQEAPQAGTEKPKDQP
jgi:tetratricopeptide (TPR) repeat protein